MMAAKTKKNRKVFYEMERLFKGAANHRRLEALALLKRRSDLSTEEIVDELDINYQTAAEHLGRLVRSGLAAKYRKGNIARYTLTSVGRAIINLWQKP